MYLQEQYALLLSKLEESLKRYETWRRSSQRKSAYVFAGNLMCSFGATVAGILKMPTVAAIFGAVLAAILTIQKSTAFDSRVTWCKGAISRCKVMINKLTIGEQNSVTLNAISEEFNKLVEDEASQPTAIKGPM